MEKKITTKECLTYIFTTLFYCTLFFETTIAQMAPMPILLESKLLTFVDGSFMNANRIEEIKRFTSKIHSLQFGDLQPDGSHQGLYRYLGVLHSIETLRNQETVPGSTDELEMLLEQAKNDFLHISDEFRNSARGSKPLIEQLIAESCEKRHRPHSILNTWAQTSPEREHLVFKKEVTNFKDLSTFLTDLCNFFADLQHSCPRACALFQERVLKYAAVKKLLPKELKKYNKPVDQTAFLAHLRRKRLDGLALEEITPRMVQELLQAFAQMKSVALDTE